MLTKQCLAFSRFARIQQHLRTTSSTSFSTSSTSSTPHEVLIDRRNNGIVLTLNRPSALNSLNLNMIRNYLYPTLKQWSESDTNDILIVKGAGAKAFCAGGDIVSIYNSIKNKTQVRNHFFLEEYRMNYLIGTTKKTQVSLLNGITMGGGVGVSVHGKYRVATENTLFAMPETSIGFFPDVGGTYFLPRLCDNFGLYLALTGARLKGYDNVLAGIATHYVPLANLVDLEAELVDAGPSKAGEILKKYHQIPEYVSEIEPHREVIKRIFDKKKVEDVIKDLEAENSEWANNVLKTLRKVSPTSLKVAQQQMNDGGSLSLLDCLELELSLSHDLTEMHDFSEGVRAQLVDKDRNPKWNPASLEDVPEKLIRELFSRKIKLFDFY